MRGRDAMAWDIITAEQAATNCRARVLAVQHGHMLYVRCKRFLVAMVGKDSMLAIHDFAGMRMMCLE